MGIKFTNNAEGDLFAGITAVATTMTLNAGQGDLFPVIGVASGDYFYGTLFDISGNREIVKCTERQAGSNVLTIVRAQDGTSARAWSAADKFELRIPSVVFEEFDTDITQNRTDINSNDVELADHESRIAAIEGGVELTGNKMYYYQNTAPTGWTIDATVDDCLLGIKGGLQAYNVSGGVIAGSWSLTQHQHTGPSHTHTVTAIHSHTIPDLTHLHATVGFALTIAHMPAHTHDIKSSKWQNGSGEGSHRQGDSTGTTGSFFTESTGTGTAHDHGNTTNGLSASLNTGNNSAGSTDLAGTGLTGLGGAPSSDRQRAAIGIIATKN